jgi:hypothetical protein
MMKGAQGGTDFSVEGGGLGTALASHVSGVYLKRHTHVLWRLRTDVTFRGRHGP